jgi:hypothetical protein
MKLPGEAKLSFEITSSAGGRGCRLVQRAQFKPRGLGGLAYWYAVLPLHGVVFSGMLDGIRVETGRIERGMRERAAAQVS